MRKLLTATLLSLVMGAGSAYAADVVVRIAPPRAVVEHRDRAPSRDHVWVSGYHRWDGVHYVWTQGRWERRPQANARGVDGHWAHHSKGYYWVDGHWK